jgi:hypothetical protein
VAAQPRPSWASAPVRAGGHSFSAIPLTAKLAGVGRSTAVEAIKRLRDLGVLTWRKTRLRVAWSLDVASRQWRNIYRLLAAMNTESSRQPTDQEPVRKKNGIEAERASPEVRQAALETLAAIAARRAA